MKPDVLIMDEPTNDLDYGLNNLVENFIANFEEKYSDSSFPHMIDIF